MTEYVHNTQVQAAEKASEEIRKVRKELETFCGERGITELSDFAAFAEKNDINPDNLPL